MGMERAYSVRHIQEITLTLVCYDIDRTTKSIGTKTRRNDALIDFNMIDHIDGKIGEIDTRTKYIERHSINKIADRITRHSVDGEVKIRTASAFCTDFHPSCSSYNIIKSDSHVRQ